jgi:hypothetical protein
MNIGEVAAASAGNEDLAAGLGAVFEKSYASATVACHGSAHQSGSACAKDDDVETAFNWLSHSSILSETYGLAWSSKGKGQLLPNRRWHLRPRFFPSKGASHVCRCNQSHCATLYARDSYGQGSRG